jgi:hypothetical protein
MGTVALKVLLELSLMRHLGVEGEGEEDGKDEDDGVEDDKLEEEEEEEEEEEVKAKKDEGEEVLGGEGSKTTSKLSVISIILSEPMLPTLQ